MNAPIDIMFSNNIRKLYIFLDVHTFILLSDIVRSCFDIRVVVIKFQSYFVRSKLSVWILLSTSKCIWEKILVKELSSLFKLKKAADYFKSYSRWNEKSNGPGKSHITEHSDFFYFILENRSLEDFHVEILSNLIFQHKPLILIACLDFLAPLTYDTKQKAIRWVSF